MDAGDGEPVIAALAEALVHDGITLETGDAVEFRWHLATATAESSAASELRDRLLFNGPPSDGYMFYFHEGPQPEAVAAAAVAEFGVPPEAIGREREGEYTGPDEPMVLLTAFATMPRVDVSAGRGFFDLAAGASELTVAKAWSHRLGYRAMLSAFGLHEDEWVLVTPEGGHGIVEVRENPDAGPDEDTGWDIAHAFEPIPGAPELHIVTEPPWWDDVEEAWVPARPCGPEPNRS
ncbi:hypothetical protein LO763_20105 [Glycomyces sp. A-F 0318]|uniref:hypothetical protein n=1 Tax=Glycomyces amatae TaxID=2881355 RepID=UPI001E361B3E|nr:hypothetical protein [Glycomyces amatae]MCD0445918.1 hypothetical protein [Glycomyces amatae]